MHKNAVSLLAAIALAAALPAVAAGQALPREPEGVLSLSGSATVQVPNDWIAVQFTITREGPDARVVQAALKEALGAALTQARQVAKAEGHVEVEGGGFSLQPSLNAKGIVNGWTGTTTLLVQGRDMGTIAELAGRVQSMSVGNLAYSVSREAREKVEGEVAAQAIARFRARAADYAKAFGYGSFVVREVNVITEAGQPNPPRPYMARAKSMASLSEALPVEAGSGTVTANVNGSVQLK